MPMKKMVNSKLVKRFDHSHLEVIDDHELQKKIRRLISRLLRSFSVRWGEQSLSYYELAWIARCHDQTSGKPLYPSQLKRLISLQNVNGSWGFVTESTRPRFLATFQAYQVLSFWIKKRQQHQHHRHLLQDSLAKARHWLEANEANLEKDWQDPAGYELILGSQLAMAETLDLDIEFATSHARQIKLWRDRKLSLLSSIDQLESSTLIHSAEALGDDVPTHHLELMLWRYGSIGCSPSATAFLFMRTDLSMPARSMLANYFSFYLNENKIPVKTFPFEVTELAWTLGYLSVVLPFNRVPRQFFSWRQRLRDIIHFQPFVGFSTSFPTPDFDDTLMCHLVLRKIGNGTPEVSIESLERWWQEDHYLTYQDERNISVATQVRALWASTWLRDDVMLENSLKWLYRKHWDKMDSWCDKYVPSPWYSLAHLVMALQDHPDPYLWPEILDMIFEWLETKQNPNGSYGIFSEENDPNTQGTAEETTLALICICILKERWNLEVSPFRVQKALSYLVMQLESDLKRGSTTWMAKAGMYVLKNVFLATVFTALLLTYFSFLS